VIRLFSWCISLVSRREIRIVLVVHKSCDKDVALRSLYSSIDVWSGLVLSFLFLGFKAVGIHDKRGSLQLMTLLTYFSPLLQNHESGDF
jgi:ATP/ADP translocase